MGQVIAKTTWPTLQFLRVTLHDFRSDEWLLTQAVTQVLEDRTQMQEGMGTRTHMDVEINTK